MSNTFLASLVSSGIAIASSSLANATLVHSSFNSHSTPKSVSAYTTDKNPSALQTGQVWQGSYICLQGKTQLKLEILLPLTTQADEQKTDSFLGIYHFNYSNQKVGDYTVHIMQDHEKVVVTPQRWIHQPANYVMVGLQGNLDSSQQHITGKVDNIMCKDFTLQLVSTAAD